MLSITVDTLVDENDGNHAAGDLSFREAIAMAANEATNPGQDTIDFSPDLFNNGPATLTLAFDGNDAGTTPDQISINASNVTIEGPGAELLSIDGDGQYRVFYVNWDATVTLRGLTVTGGGNIDAGAGIYNNGVLNIESARVTGNETTGLTTGNDFGGGIASAGTLRVIASTIDNNQARWGAGISFTAGSATTILDIRDSAIYENQALDQGGGGLAGGLSIKSTSNQAPLSIVNSTISNNTAAESAGIRVDWLANLKIVNSTITQNQATSGVNGGLMLIDPASATTLHNSIVAGNFDSVGGTAHRDIVTWGGTYIADSSYNLIGVAGNSGFVHNEDHNIVGTAVAPINPSLAPLGDYGGPTNSHALLVGSPALDAGSDQHAVYFSGMPLIFDQRGHQRPFDLSDVSNGSGGWVDIGAFEAGNPTPFEVKTLDDELDDINAPNFDPNDMSLREALAKAATHAGPDEIVFSPNIVGEIVLDTELGSLVIDSDVAIKGPGADVLAINANAPSWPFMRPFSIENSVVTIADLTLTGGNGGYTGGAIESINSDLDLWRVNVTGNNNDDGGATVWVYQGALTVVDSTIDNNNGTWGFGGILVHEASLIVYGSTISNNRGASAGIEFWGYNGEPIWIMNSTISGNSGTHGANDMVGVYATTTGTAEIINSTITDNRAGWEAAGVIVGDGTLLTLYNTIVAGNSEIEDFGADWDLSVIGTGAFHTGSSNNLIGYDPNGYFPSGNNNQIGTTTPLDPKLLPLGNYGGRTKTHALQPDSPAIDAGWDDVAYQYDLIFDQIGSGFDRILGAAVDIGASESHIIVRPSVGVVIFGTQLDDVITVTDNAVTIDRIGTFSLDIASPNEVVVFAMDGNDNVSAASLSRAVALFGGDGDDTLTGGSGDDTIFGGQGVNAVNDGAGNNIVNAGGNVDFEPGLVEFSAVPPGTMAITVDGTPVPVDSNPFLLATSDGDNWQGSDMHVGWDIIPQNFLLAGSLRVDQIAIVQIVKTTIEWERWFWPKTEFRDWHVDAPLGDLVYPITSPVWPGSTTEITLSSNVQGIQGIISLTDGPGAVGYGYDPDPHRLVHLKQEFETYIVGLGGMEGIEVDVHDSSLFLIQSFKSATVYGGIKWYHEIDFDHQTATYNLVGRQVTDTTGSPTDNLTNALHDFFDFEYFVSTPA